MARIEVFIDDDGQRTDFGGHVYICEHCGGDVDPNAEDEQYGQWYYGAGMLHRACERALYSLNPTAEKKG